MTSQKAFGIHCRKHWWILFKTWREYYPVTPSDCTTRHFSWRRKYEKKQQSGLISHTGVSSRCSNISHTDSRFNCLNHDKNVHDLVTKSKQFPYIQRFRKNYTKANYVAVKTDTFNKFELFQLFLTATIICFLPNQWQGNVAVPQFNNYCSNTKFVKTDMSQTITDFRVTSNNSCLVNFVCDWIIDHCQRFRNGRLVKTNINRCKIFTGWSFMHAASLSAMFILLFPVMV